MVTAARSSCDLRGLRALQHLQRLDIGGQFLAAICAVPPGHPPCSPDSVAWNPGEHLAVRGTDWRVVQSTAHVDCTVLYLASVEGPPVMRTVMLPFDRPRRVPVPRLTVMSPRLWAEHLGARLGQTFPFGGLRFCPRAIQLLAYQLEPALAVFRHSATRVLIGDDVGWGRRWRQG